MSRTCLTLVVYIPSLLMIVATAIKGDTSIASQAQAEQPPLEDIFVAGRDGYHTYRIPSLILSTKGTLLAFCEGRGKSASDTGDIDVVLRRSTDGGRRWDKMQVIADDGLNTVGNPCPVVDRNTGVIHLLLTWNLGTDSEQAILGGTSKDTRRVWIMSSSDDGITWSKPADITTSVKKPGWTWYATGPGAGIQLRSGRLLIPCDNAVAGTKAYQSHAIYSDDHGKTWAIGGVVGEKLNECQAAELSDGSVLINMRSYRGKQCRAVAVSRDGGLTWSEVRDDPALVEPICQASLLGFPGDVTRKGCLLFANPADPKQRRRMMMRVSYDDGKTWPVARVLYAGSAAYSSLAALPDGRIACLFERDNCRRISLATFPLPIAETQPKSEDDAR